MRFNDVLTTISKNTWWSEEFPAVFATIGDALRAFVEQGKYFLPGVPTLCIFLYKDDFCYEETSIEEKQMVYDHIASEMINDPGYLKQRRKQCQRVATRVHTSGKALVKVCKSHASPATLWRQYRNLTMHYRDFARYGVALECVDVFSAERLPGMIREQCRIDDQKALEVAITMCAPRMLSFFEQEELMIFQTARILSNALTYHPHVHPSELLAHHPDAQTIVNTIVNKFYWISNNYKETRVLNKAYVVGRAKELVQKQSLQEINHNIHQYETKVQRLTASQHRLTRRYYFSPELRRHFAIVSFIAAWIDDRKRTMTEVNYYIDTFCNEVASRFHLDPWLVKYYTPEEFGRLLTKNKPVPVGTLRKRQKFCAQVVAPGKHGKIQEQLFYGRDAQCIYDALFARDTKAELRGQIACAPVQSITGTAQIILDVNRQEFKTGNILVTTMTRPEFVPLMRKASAIITDEGGLTCHAAIVSRELGIPCIIGAKQATKRLHDHDTIRLDLKTGMIIKQ